MSPLSQAQVAQQPSRPAAILMGLACLAGGLAVVAAATGVLPTQPGTLEAPRWVVGCAGVIFISGSLVPLNAAFGLPGWVNRLVALTVGVGLALVFNWIAFVPGERHFSSTFSVPGVSVSGDSGAIAGRIVFGIGALLIDAIVLYGVWHQLRGRSTQAPPRTDGEQTR
jgi:hypothetical protein